MVCFLSSRDGFHFVFKRDDDMKPVILGKGPDVAKVLLGAKVSRQHCTFFCHDGGLFIKDCPQKDGQPSRHGNWRYNA
jgi:hypothetical protein